MCGCYEQRRKGHPTPTPRCFLTCCPARTAGGPCRSLDPPVSPLEGGPWRPGAPRVGWGAACWHLCPVPRQRLPAGGLNHHRGNAAVAGPPRFTGAGVSGSPGTPLGAGPSFLSRRSWGRRAGWGGGTPALGAQRAVGSPSRDRSLGPFRQDAA